MALRYADEVASIGYHFFDPLFAQLVFDPFHEIAAGEGIQFDVPTAIAVKVSAVAEELDFLRGRTILA